MSKDSIPLQRPIRPDKEYLYGLTKAVFIMRVAVIGLIVSVLILGGIAFVSMNRPRLVTVVDLSSGKTLTSIGKTEVGSEVLEQQLVYYSRQFCESFLCADHVTIREARKAAVELMHPDLASKLPKDWLDDGDVRECIENKTTSYFDWTLKPAVTTKNDPRYSVFCQFTKEVRKEGFQPVKTRYNIRLDWGRLVKNTDPFNRPHSLVLLNFEQLQDESKINEQLKMVK